MTWKMILHFKVYKNIIPEHVATRNNFILQNITIEWPFPPSMSNSDLFNLVLLTRAKSFKKII